ncbi:hypothetical protein CsatB_001783 [Cannabis sativa]|uniref:LOB domain-containing protein n=1 Tax=Cannabis sativa TaxID=3483 RepID=A0A803QEE1_CANSA|nr:LOB domain-containing protein 4-like [Cannabis sativa]XP_060975003.1 LOB domain-containing protein 4-like [Cannabis sativa]
MEDNPPPENNPPLEDDPQPEDDPQLEDDQPPEDNPLACSACKFLRRKCNEGCIYAPYFPHYEPQKFATIHRVYGASNVSKILNGINPNQRMAAVNSLFYEAQARIRDPVYGVIGFISILHNRLNQTRSKINSTSNDLATHIGPHPAQFDQLHPHPDHNSVPPMPTNPELRPFYFENIPLSQQQDANNNVGVRGPTAPMSSPEVMEQFHWQMAAASPFYRGNRRGDDGASSSRAAAAANDDAPNDFSLHSQLQNLLQLNVDLKEADDNEKDNN